MPYFSTHKLLRNSDNVDYIAIFKLIISQKIYYKLKVYKVYKVMSPLKYRENASVTGKTSGRQQLATWSNMHTSTNQFQKGCMTYWLRGLVSIELYCIPHQKQSFLQHVIHIAITIITAITFCSLHVLLVWSWELARVGRSERCQITCRPTM